MNLNTRGKKRSWLNLRYYPNIRLEGLGKITNTFSQDSRPLARDLNPGHPEYEEGVLTLGRDSSDVTGAILNGQRSNYGEKA
jgi:hypothetical protein